MNLRYCTKKFWEPDGLPGEKVPLPGSISNNSVHIRTRPRNRAKIAFIC